jgi:MFS family permease
MNENPATATSWFHPSRRAYRFTILLFTGAAMYGSYFAYDSIGAIEDSLMAALGVGQSEIGLLYSLYSLGPILLLFAAGMLADRIGTRAASMIFSGLILLGAVLVAMAPTVWVMYMARVVFGYGSEAFLVVQNVILVRWFKGKELALAFGATLTIMRLGTLFSFNTEALIAERFGPYTALWVAAGLCAASFCANLVYVVLDKRAERSLRLTEEEAGDRIVVSHIKRLGAPFWYVTAICVTFYSAIFPFTALSTNFFHEKWHLPLSSGAEGGFLTQVFDNFLNMFSTAPGTTSIIIFASMIFAPFAGGLVDKIGRRASLMVVGSLIMVPAYLTLGFTHAPPWIPMIALGAAFVLVPAAMWPTIPLIVDKHFTGTAYGVMTQVQNIGLFLFPFLNGWLREATHSYEASMIMFSSLGFVGLFFSVMLLRANRTVGGVIESP